MNSSESRTERSCHQTVSQAACDVIAAPMGKSLSVLLRRIRGRGSSTAVCWLAGCGRVLLNSWVSQEDCCQGNRYKWRGRVRQLHTRQTNKQINKQDNDWWLCPHVLVILCCSFPTVRCVLRLPMKSWIEVRHVFAAFLSASNASVFYNWIIIIVIRIQFLNTN